MRVRKPKALSKTAQLEQKLDGLMAKLQPNSDQTTQSPAPIHCDQESSSESVNQVATSVSDEPSHHGLLTVFSAVEEEELLQAFCRDKLYYFPFINITPGTSAQQLKQTSPFLWQCIGAAQASNSIQQALIAANIRETAARKLLVDCNKSLDLLQGLLVYAGW